MNADAFLSDQYLSDLATSITEHCGIAFTDDKLSDLKRIVLLSCKEKQVHTREECGRYLSYLLEKPCNDETFIHHLTTKETYFFRDKKLHLALKNTILPGIIARKRENGHRIRIWSAACSSGEEPYSIAIIIHSILSDLRTWDIQILATDINTRVLEQAKTGRYSSWSFREEAPVDIDRYIKKNKDTTATVTEEIQRMVTFQRVNLVDEKMMSSIVTRESVDLLLCRNVLMYLREDKAARVVDLLNASLHKEGVLVVSPQELSETLFSGFTQVWVSGVYLYVKPDSFLAQNHSVTGTRMGSIETTVTEFKPSRDLLKKRPHRDIPNQIQTKPIQARSAARDPTGELHQKKQDTIAEQGSGDPYEQALISLSRGDTKAAEMFFTEILTDDPTRIDALTRLVDIYVQTKRTDEGLAVCDRILLSTPIQPRVHYLKATMYEQNGDIKSAFRTLRQSLYADRNFIPAHLMISALYKEQGRREDASRHLAEILSIMDRMEETEIAAETDGIPVARLREMVCAMMEAQ